MKAILPIIALMAAPVVCTQAYGAENVGVLNGYLPTDGTMKTGVAVAPQLTPEFAKMQQELVKKLRSLPEAKQKAFMEKYNPMILPTYDAEIWPDKAAYDSYKAEWKKSGIAALREVAIGLRSLGNNTWSVLSLTVDPQTRRSAPLTISALKYDAGKNVWISNNGELTAKTYEATEEHLYGAQTGTEWSLSKEDSLSKMSETVRISKTTDGKAVYISYAFDERSAISNAVIAQGAYTIRLAVKTAQVNMGSPGSR